MTVMAMTLLPVCPVAAYETEGYYEYSIWNGEATIEYCDEYISGDITIPDTLGGYPVTGIGRYAFSYCWDLSSVIIPEGVTYIGYAAFRNCRYLSDVTIPDSVTTIEDSAFHSCRNLTSVMIPANVTSIGYWAFGNCDNLRNILVSESNSHYCSVDGNLFDKDKTTLLQYAPGKENSSYVIPDGITSIHASAFEGCDGLTSVSIPDTVTAIREYAFYGCENLTSITIPTGVTSIQYATFESCYSLASVSIPDSVTTIGDYAFYDCQSLTSITIPKNVTYIGEGAFERCDGLTDVFFLGTQSEWEDINISYYNDSLVNATIHFAESDDVDEDVVSLEGVACFTINNKK